METETTQSNQRYKLIQDLAQTGYQDSAVPGTEPTFA
jgi:hypothetical protein